MTDEEQKIAAAKLKAIKVKPALHRAIDIESANTGISMYALVEKAWECYLDSKRAQQFSMEAGSSEIAKSGEYKKPTDTEKPGIRTVTAGLKSDPIAPQESYQEEESGWFKKQYARLAKIAQSGPQQVREAIAANLEVFAMVSGLMEERRGRSGTKVPGAKVAPDITGEISKAQEAEGATRRGMAELGREIGSAERLASELEKTRENLRGGERGHQKPTRKRGGYREVG